jgi:hypothetical protein
LLPSQLTKDDGNYFIINHLWLDVFDNRFVYCK